MDFTAGMLIARHVLLVRRLGEGGMATVWVGDHLRKGTQVAVKFISSHLVDHEGYRARFAREVRLARTIESPHIVQVFDAGLVDDRVPYIVMELLEGETLADRLRRDHVMSPVDALSVTLQIAKALSAAHAAGVVHRDIKPANVFLLRGASPLVKLLDFGIAKVVGGNVSVVTGNDETLGTPAYMSPQQLRYANKVDYRADIWSSAVLAYRMLLGVLPFDGADYPSICMAVYDGAFQLPREIHDDWPVELDAWFARSFQRDRDHRYESAQEAAAALRAAIIAIGNRRPRPVPRPGVSTRGG